MVSRLFCSLSGFVFRRRSALVLAFSWAAGLWCGIELFQASGFSGFLREDSLTGPVSPGFLVLRVVVPFLICVVGMLLEKHWLIYGCAFGKGVLLSFVSLCTMAAFGSGGWLVRFLLVFTDTAVCGLCYGFWHHCLSEGNFSPARGLLLCSLGLVFAGLDLRVITPLVIRIFNL